MSSEFGNKIKLSIFGESHGEAIGCVIDSIPAGVKLDMEKIYFDMARRAPGKDKTATPRLEKDIPHILSGVLNGVTTGAPLAMIIENTNTKSGDYSNLLSVPRPSHSDYPAYVKYQGNNDIRGGGHFSFLIPSIIPVQPPPINLPSRYLTMKKNSVKIILIAIASLKGNTIPDITHKNPIGIGSWHFAI